jgi:galactoside O-acetyltransferase
MKTSFLSQEELRQIPFRSVGTGVQLSRHATFYHPENISIGDHSRVDDFCIMSGGTGISIGSFVHVAAYTALYGHAGIELADFANLSSRVVLYTYSDDFSGATLTNPTIPPRFRRNPAVGPISIGRHAIVGTNSTVLPNAVIGEGAAVGAYSLVKAPLEPWGIYAGVPARFLKARRRDLLKDEETFLNEIRAPL